MHVFLSLFLLSSSSTAPWQPSTSLPSFSGDGRLTENDVGQMQKILVDYIALKMKYKHATDIQNALVCQLNSANAEVARLQEELEWKIEQQEDTVEVSIVESQPSVEIEEAWAGTGETPEMTTVATPLWEDRPDAQLLSTQLSISNSYVAQLQNLLLEQKEENLALNAAMSMAAAKTDEVEEYFTHQIKAELEKSQQLEKQLSNLHYEKKGLEIQLGIAQQETEKAKVEVKNAQDLATYYRNRYDQLFAAQERKLKDALKKNGHLEAKMAEVQLENSKLQQLTQQNMAWNGKSQDTPHPLTMWNMSPPWSPQSSSFPSSSVEENELQQTGDSWNVNHDTNQPMQTMWSPPLESDHSKHFPVTLLGPFFAPVH